jgi:5-methylcytosine-specific restriction protein A
MDDGSIYLETHHVFQLALGGPKEVWNVVAVCANDHLLLFFSKERP